MTNPFLKYGDMLRADYGAAIRIQSLVLHLFNSKEHPVDLVYLLRGTDEHHRAAAREMMDWYTEHGESDGVFMEAARTLSTDRSFRAHVVSWGCACGAAPGWYERSGGRPYLACTECDAPVRPPVELD